MLSSLARLGQLDQNSAQFEKIQFHSKKIIGRDLDAMYNMTLMTAKIPDYIDKSGITSCNYIILHTTCIALLIDRNGIYEMYSV